MNDTKPKRKAVFFDRDGVINQDIGYLYKIEDFVWNEGAQAAIKRLHQAGYLVIVVTNQSGVARGYYEEAQVVQLHQWMNEELGKVGAHIDDFFYCPHHPEAKVEAYRKRCDCRKPAPGMLVRAQAKWNIDFNDSFLVGDKPRDIEAANRANVAGYLFEGGSLCSFIDGILRSIYKSL
ncbi:D-glycero-beta-D-manno-heptose 1,7-bisphosphate 7-phosphatase [Heliobacterium gestii]|uniref:D,D-heptose 1,7-bisphosphate phosphatase n=1 Tax=Heliomicrobium gestii TaxID=2699 RepID=A0A845L9X5_HELGE|nr:D-glycero-beta-D-manno-heptose 1,7-bisphosphate 7-phosphatase [Heliomicrobium gestii]MBM7866702.1 D-glycero-D-manno-heptose 1,7-bisphosphate phosphatase [Heliomicrobium gestii]MZP43018.1 D-glycero-beta-D-manno-heptose 1,7-bisphosphate 7-phosphatase [Heliomicrobium gestii]